MESIESDDLAERIGIEIEPAHEPIGRIRLYHDPDLGHVEILYVAADPFPPADFWSRDGRGRIVECGMADAPVACRIRISEDAACVASPSDGPPGRGDRDLVPPVTMLRAHAEGRIGAGDLARWGEAEVAAYDAWRRGEVYGVVRESLSLSRGGLGNTDVQARWDVLDLAGAERALAEAAERREAELEAAVSPRP